MKDERRQRQQQQQEAQKERQIEGETERQSRAGRGEQVQRCTILAPQVLIKCCSQVSVTHADIA